MPTTHTRFMFECVRCLDRKQVTIKDEQVDPVSPYDVTPNFAYGSRLSFNMDAPYDERLHGDKRPVNLSGDLCDNCMEDFKVWMDSVNE